MMFDDNFNHKAIMDALIKPDSQPLTDTRVNCLHIRGISDYCYGDNYGDSYDSDDIYDNDDNDGHFEHDDELRSLAKSLQDTYDTSHRHLQGNSSIESSQPGHIHANSPTPHQSEIDHGTLMSPSTLQSKELETTYHKVEETDGHLVKILGSTEQEDSKMSSFESIMDYMLDTIQEDSKMSSFENIMGYKQDTMQCTCTKYVETCSDDEEYKYCIINTVGESTKITAVNLSCVVKVQRDILQYLATILKVTQIHSLDLSDNRIYMKQFACYLKDDTKIMSLSLRACKIGNRELEILALVLKDTQITSLDLSDNELGYKSLEVLAPCLKGTKITCLNLSSNKIVFGLQIIGDVLKHTEIASIDLSRNMLICQSLEVFAPYLVDTKVKFLSLKGNTKIGIKGLKCLAQVLKNTQITSIDLSSNYFGSECLKVFASCLVDTKITSLVLKENKIGVDGLNCLAQVLKNTQITSIDLSSNYFDSECLKVFAACLVDTKISSLYLSGCLIGTDELSCLGNVLKNTQITTLDLSNNRLNCEKLEVFAPCLVGSKITSLNLSSNDIGLPDMWSNNTGFEGMNCLAHVLKDTEITSIDLGYNHLSLDILEVFVRCLVDTTIISLGLKGNYLCIDDYSSHLSYSCFVTFLKDTQISSIDISENNLSSKNLAMFSPCLVNSKITSLDLRGNVLRCGIKGLISVLENTSINELNLECCSLECNDMKNLVMCLPDTRITTLYLSGNYNMCCNCFYLASVSKHIRMVPLDLKKFKSLSFEVTDFCRRLKDNGTSLKLNSQHVCTFSLYYLARILSNSKIVSLNLHSIGIECEGLKYVSQGLLGSQIVELDLCDNKIDCTGVYYLAQVLRNTRISSLDLSYNKISCEGLKHLSQGLEGSQISSLDLSNNSIKDEGINYLAESIVRTKIVKLDLLANIIGKKAAYKLCKSIGQGTILITIKDEVLSSHLHVFKYQNCFIEINQPPLKKGLGHLINNAYQKNGITKLIFSRYLHDISDLAGGFDKINITEIEIFGVGSNIHDIPSIFENTNIVELKMDWKQFCENMFSKMKVIALHFRIEAYTKLLIRDLKSALVNSSIVYLDLRNEELEAGQFKNLVAVLKHTKIISLNLSNTNMAANRVELLAKVLPHTKITYIDLHDNKIGNLGFKYLMNIVGKTSIGWLSLENNHIEEGLHKLSPYIVARNYTPIEFQIRYLFRELVSLNTTNQQFEFVMPREDSVMTINHYPRLVKHLLETPSLNMHIYDYFYMLSKRHDIQVLNNINAFIEDIKQKFISFFVNNLIGLQEKFGYDCFVGLVKECEHPKMTDFVEFLLLHRVLYYVDDEKNFLHPFIYRMLHKHKMPLYNEDMEPNKKQEIISYFEKHSHIDGAQEIIDLLVSD